VTSARTGEWVFVLDNEDRKALATHIARPGARVFARTLAMARTLRGTGIAAELWDDHFPLNDQERLQSCVAELRDTWPRKLNGGRLASALEFQGIDLVPLVAYCVNYGLCEALRSVATLNSVLQTGAPTSVHVGRADDMLALRLASHCKGAGVPFESVLPASAPRARKKRAGWTKATASFWRTLRGLRRLARSKSALRALVRRGRYSSPVVRDQAHRMESYVFDGEGRRTRAFLKLAGIVSTETRAGLRAADAKIAELRELFRGLGPLELDFEGTNLGPLLEPVLCTLFDHARSHRYENDYATNTARSIEPVLLQLLHARFLITRGRPDVLLVTHDSLDLDLALVEVARASGVPSAVLQHGVPAAYFPQRADRFLAWGPDVPAIYERTGEPAGRYVVTGRPAAPVTTPAAPYCAPAGPRIVTYIGQPSTGLSVGDWHVHWERQVFSLFEGLAAMESVHLLLRPHPREDSGRYLHIASEAGFENLTIPAGELNSVLAASDIVLMRNSTVSLDALALEKKLVILDAYPGKPMLSFGDEIPVAHDGAELRNALREAFAKADSAAPNFMNGQLAFSGKAATDRIFEALVELRGR